MSFKGRTISRPNTPRGCDHFRSRFTEADILEIRDMRSRGMSYAAIGRTYDVRADSIRNICLGYTYANVGGQLTDSSSGKRIIDESLAEKIRDDYHSGMSFKKICTKYKIGMVAAHRVIHGSKDGRGDEANKAD